VLSKRLTTKLAKTDIRDVYAAFAKQADITIEIDKSVPTYKLDVYLKATTLKYALDHIKTATGLDYQFTDHDTIRIYKPTPESNGVAIANPTRTH
jgi:hypothetical protein